MSQIQRPHFWIYLYRTKIFDKRDDFDFDIVNFPFLDGDVPRSTPYGVYISQLIRFVRASSNVDDFNTRNKVLTAKLLRQGYRYHKPHKAFSKFYRRHFDLVSKYNVRLKTLLQQGLSEPEFYGDLVYKFRKIIGKYDFPYHFEKTISLLAVPRRLFCFGSLVILDVARCYSWL